MTGDFVEDVRDRVEHAKEIRHVAVAIDVPAVEAMLFLLEHPPVTIDALYVSEDLERKAITCRCVNCLIEDSEDGFGNA